MRSIPDTPRYLPARNDSVKLGRVGFEPTTPALKGRCSTTELTTRTNS